MTDCVDYLEVYEGDWEKGKYHGKGKLILSFSPFSPSLVGDIYEGDFVEGKKHGNGRMDYYNGDIYEGEWEENDHHGKGKYTNTTYPGKVTDPTYQVYIGDWENGRAHGKGKVIKNGEVLYDGTWEATTKTYKPWMVGGKRMDSGRQCNRREIDDNCAICCEKLLVMYDNIVWHECGCGNAIHETCLKEWFVKGNTESCPHCRKGWNDRCLWGTNRVPWCAL